jgi:hypothetical protein
MVPVVQIDDPLTLVVRRVRSVLANTGDMQTRVRAFWAAAKYARKLAAADVVTETFMALAIDANLIDRRGRWISAEIAERRRPYGREDIAHIVSWAVRGMNPFDTGRSYDD